MVSPAAPALALFWIVIQVHLSIAASCTQSGWEWSHNSLGQDPCAVVQILEAKCKNQTSFDLEPLKSGTNYLTPQEGEATDCSCNTVTYSLYQACSQCQIPRSGNMWSFYDKFCPQVYVTQIPLDIPDDTQVPPWAYLDVTKDDHFNPTAARALADPNASDSPVSTGMSSGSDDPPAPTPSATGSAGLIVGGVVGGMLVAASAITLVWFFFLRKKKPTKLKKLKLERKLNQTEVSLLSPGPLSPPKITRDLPKNATYRELSRSGVMTGYDSSFYPKNTVAPSKNGYHGFAEV